MAHLGSMKAGGVEIEDVVLVFAGRALARARAWKIVWGWIGV